jgi:O-antigen/teichoic acid export membrane protein
VNIAINIFLLPKIGFIAAAYSTLIAHVTMTVLLYLVVRRFYSVPYEYGRLGKICVAGAVVFVVLSPHLQDTSIEGVIARVIFVAGYPLILWGWRFFTS